MTTTEKKVASLFDTLGIDAGAASILGDKIDDEELLQGVELIFVSCARFKVEGGPAGDRPMEVWHAAQKSPTTGAWVFRSIRGRSELAGRLRTQCLEFGIAFANKGTGEITFTPGEEGMWFLVDRKQNEPKFLAAFVSIRRDKGKLAGSGRAFSYGVRGHGVLQSQAVAKIPELPIDGVKLLTVDPTDATDDELKTVDAKVTQPKNGKRK